MADFLSNLSLNNILHAITGYIGFKGPIDVIRAVVEISVVSYVVYKLIQLVKETRAIQLIKGVIVILIVYILSNKLGLKTIEFIIRSAIPIFGFAAIALFQPELRRGLEKIGRSRLSDFFSFEEDSSLIQTTSVIEEIIKATQELSGTLTGALIVIERDTKIGEIINTGTQLESLVSKELLINIFTPNTPLHDGAVIIRNNKIKAAACFLPLTDNPNLSKDLGTRHRAALGITEISDAFAVVVSEETGKISFALNGGLTRNLTSDTLRKALNKNLLEKNSSHKNRKIALWRVKSK